MDFRQPVEAVIPGVQGRILAVLAETTAELNLRTIARLSGVSPAQASRVLPELVALGLVERREAPPSALFALIEDNVAGRLVRSLSRSRETVLEELGALAGQMDPTPVSVIVFGSLARGEADALSDVDVVLVRPPDVDEDDESWASSAERWRTAARRLTGNAVQVIEIDEAEVARRLRRPAELWANVLREGLVVHGSSLQSLRGRRNA
ncbi:MAG: helix-turn-helix domain-containing protein [Candidatus Nanopelagicales bacterium]|nr:helix-turn-helix domain-containing protein [Candidatus Nanopelagicales bacterium]